MTANLPHDLKELDYRTTSYGLTVSLLWDETTGETFIEMETADDWSRFQVAPEKATDAFNHPFVYRAETSHDYTPVTV